VTANFIAVPPAAAIEAHSTLVFVTTRQLFSICTPFTVGVFPKRAVTTPSPTTLAGPKWSPSMRTVVLLEVDKVPTTSVMMGLAYRTVALDEEVTVVVPMELAAPSDRLTLRPNPTPSTVEHRISVFVTATMQLDVTM
jgi:hypothetical protein